MGCSSDVKCMHVVFSRTLLDSNVLALLCFLLAYIHIYQALTEKQFFFFSFFFFPPKNIHIHGEAKEAQGAGRVLLDSGGEWSHFGEGRVQIQARVKQFYFRPLLILFLDLTS